MPCGEPVPHNERADHISGDLGRLITMIGVAIAFFGVLLLAIIAYAGWSANETATDGSGPSSKTRSIRASRACSTSRRASRGGTIPSTKITDEAIDLDFTDANFGIFLTETYGHDEVYILNAADKPLYAFFGGKREEPPTFETPPARDSGCDCTRRAAASPPDSSPRPDMFSESQSNYRILAGAAHVARWAGHIVSIDGRPCRRRRLTIVPNIDMSLLKGTPNLLLSITYIDDGFISEIGRTLLLPDLAAGSPSRRWATGFVSEAFRRRRRHSGRISNLDNAATR